MDIFNKNFIYDKNRFISTYKKDFIIPKIKINNLKNQKDFCNKLSTPKYLPIEPKYLSIKPKYLPKKTKK